MVNIGALIEELEILVTFEERGGKAQNLLGDRSIICNQFKR